MKLWIDLETYSEVDLTKSTVYKYAEDPSFRILLFSYAVDDGPVQVLDLTQNDVIPGKVLQMLTHPNVEKHAYNANFERVCLAYRLNEYLPVNQWRCTMVHAMSCGLPRSLADVGRALGLPEDKAKMKEGAELIRYFCKPCKPTKTNGGRTRNLPEHAPEKWELFKEYNRRDVEAEREIERRISQYPVPEDEWKAYWLDQQINDRGVLVDRKLVESAVKISREHTALLTEEAVNLTGLSNVNSVAQLKSWLGVEGSLDKKAIRSMRDSGNLSLKEDRLLAIRQEMGKTSISKYEAMERGACRDGRIRGLFQFYGAGRTGRWAGRQVQVQNLPQNHIDDLDTARTLALEADRESLALLYGNVPDTLSQLIRTAFIAGAGRTFAVADFSAIEARVLAWLAGEKWRMAVFEQGTDIYCASASKMFGVPVEKHGVNGHLRQKGKIAELALGYGGAVGALTQMGALEMGLKQEELQPLVDAWRASNVWITKFWWDVGACAENAIKAPGCPVSLRLACGKKLIFLSRGDSLAIRLPSGRNLRYWRPKYDETTRQITYDGMEAGKWGRVETYGPKLVENVVQAIARDCLKEAMLRVDNLKIVMHIHDEMVVETEKADSFETLQTMLQAMNVPIPWAPGLLLKGDGYVTDYYRKD